MTAAASAGGILAALAAQLAMFAALLLAASGLHKSIARSRARAAVAGFAGVPRRLAPSAAVLIAAIELLAGALLWLPSHRVQGAVLAAAVWTVYLVLMLRAMADGRRDVDCGCSFGRAHGPLGAPQVLRNAVLVAIAIFVAAVSAADAPISMTVQQLPAALALLALYGAFDQVMGLRPLRAGELL